MTSLNKNGFLPMAALVSSAVVAIAMIASGLGNRWGWWGFAVGFKILTFAAFLEALIAVIALAACFLPIGGRPQRAIVMLVAAIVIAVLVLSVPIKMAMAARSLPYIHDITTDTDNPPQFDDSIRRLRADSPNTVDYEGAELAAKQHKAYPDIRPMVLALPPDKAYGTALAAARAFGWDIVSASAEKGFIEATATTFWYGFKDDIAIRITPLNVGSRIDVRSVSRLGKSDIGANAGRIRKYFGKIKLMRGATGTLP